MPSVCALAAVKWLLSHGRDTRACWEQGASSGIMRFKKLEDAEAALGKADADGNITISDVAGTLTKVEGMRARVAYSLCLS